MTKLAQVLAIEKQVKTNSGQNLTNVYQALQKESLLNGITRTYRPSNDDGEKFPSEKQEVQLRVGKALDFIAVNLTPLYDVVAQKDAGNLAARADVVVDGKTLLSNVPAVTLLYLEKQLVDIHTIVVKLPELPQTESWEYSENFDCYITKPTETAKTKKIAKPFVKAEATKEHPAQVDVVHDDVLQGYWSTVKFSGAIPADRKRTLRERVEKLLIAVKFARQLANQAEAPKVSVGAELFNYLLAT